MHFAHALPWWLAVVLAAAVAGAAVLEYRQPASPLTPVRRGVLVGFRTLALALLILFAFRPIVMLPPSGSRDVVVPVLVDVSRSMRVADADGQSRLTQATSVLTTVLLPALSPHFTIDLFSVGETLEPATVERLTAAARRTDVTGALAAVRERYRGQRLAGIVLLSDGADTGSAGAGTSGPETDGPPVFTVGLGSPDGVADREVVGLVAGDPQLDRASVDLHVTAVSSGFGPAPFPLRVLANGRVVDTRRLVPVADGSPIDEVVTVFPDGVTPTVYTAEIPADQPEAVVENNSRSVLVRPAGRRRRLLVIEGAPGFEHSFITRALSADSGLDVDAVTRKGRNAEGAATFFVQAGGGRAGALTTGFPSTRDRLYAYDAIVLANVDRDELTKSQLAQVADFVSERGGGLLVMGGRSFARQSLANTPLDSVLPVELSDRRGGLVRASLGALAMAAPNTVALTPEGEIHPIMRIAPTPAEARTAWAALPALAASAPLGGPRPGATVLAMTTAPGGGVFPVVAVQRYGHGRSMVFGGEASWRWKMMVPSTDRSYELFWRQAVRWLASAAQDPVAISAPDAVEPGDLMSVDVDVRDAAFASVEDAAIDATVTAPGGEPQSVVLRHADAAHGRQTAAFRPEQAGVYHLRAAARRGTTPLGTADHWVYVGGADREFAEPRLNEGLLRRVARDSGGRYVRAADAARVAAWLAAALPESPAAEPRDLWHEPWAFALVAVLLTGEWILRRIWGLR